MENSQEFTRPFNLEHARAGAPFAALDGQAVEMLKWDMSGRRPLFGLVGDMQREVRWSQVGTVTLYRKDPFDLVMLPLGLIDGKPFFVGDTIIGASGGTFVAEPRDKDGYIEAWRWPAPASAYPETAMSLSQLEDAFKPRTDVLWSSKACKNLANAALRHAIDAGQVVTTEAHEAALILLGERLAGIAIDRPSRRDMNIANAVLIACHNYADGYHQRCARELMDIDLAAIINEVKS